MKKMHQLGVGGRGWRRFEVFIAAYLDQNTSLQLKKEVGGIGFYVGAQDPGWSYVAECIFLVGQTAC